MKSKNYIKGIATTSFKNDYNRCSSCGKIFDIGDNVNTKTDEMDINLCDECFIRTT